MQRELKMTEGKIKKPFWSQKKEQIDNSANKVGLGSKTKRHLQPSEHKKWQRHAASSNMPGEPHLNFHVLQRPKS